MSWLSNLGFDKPEISYQSDHQFLTQETLRLNRGRLTNKNVLTINTGVFTGRSPEDRFIVKDAHTENKIWWGDINKPFDSSAFLNLKKKIVKYLDKKHLYIRDAIAGTDKRHQLKLRIVNEFPEHNLFSGNMFINPQEESLTNFKPEWTILHAPEFNADPITDRTRQGNFAIISFSEKMIIKLQSY